MKAKTVSQTSAQYRITLFLLLFFSLGLSACSSLPSIPFTQQVDADSSIEKHDQSNVEVDIENLRRDIASIQPTINRMIELETGFETIKRYLASMEPSINRLMELEDGLETLGSDLESLDSIRRDLVSIKPAINRLMELETGLESIISSANPKALLTYPNIQTFDAPEDELADNNLSENSKPIFFENADATSNDTNKVIPVSFNQSSLSNSAKTESAPRISRELTVNVASNNNYAREDIGHIDNKFSSSVNMQNQRTVGSFRNVNSVQADQDTENDKFNLRETGPNIKATSNTDMTCNASSINDRYAVHVASFKNRQNALSTLEELAEKIKINKLCPTYKMIAEVFVKDTLFYSARLGAFNSKEDAARYCKNLASLTSYCAVIGNEGDRVL